MKLQWKHQNILVPNVEDRANAMLVLIQGTENVPLALERVTIPILIYAIDVAELLIVNYVEAMENVFMALINFIYKYTLDLKCISIFKIYNS